MLLSYWLTSFWLSGKDSVKVWKGIPVFLVIGTTIGLVTTVFMVEHVYFNPDYTPMEAHPTLITFLGVFLVTWILIYFVASSVLFIRELTRLCRSSTPKAKFQAITNYIWMIITLVYLGYAIMDMSYVNGGF